MHMTEQELRQIHRNNMEMGRLQADYETICGSFGISPVQSDGMPHGSGEKSNGMSDVEEKVDIEIRYRQLYWENEKLIRKAREYIDQFPDEILRQVLTARYINGMEIMMVAADVGLTMNQCEVICKVHFNNVF